VNDRAAWQGPQAFGHAAVAIPPASGPDAGSETEARNVRGFVDPRRTEDGAGRPVGAGDGHDAGAYDWRHNAVWSWRAIATS
jgi:hypothetical protein